MRRHLLEKRKQQIKHIKHKNITEKRDIMLNVYKLGTPECNEFFEKLSKRAGSPDPAVVETVNAILKDVKTRGDEAVLEYTAKFDRVNLDSSTLEMSREDLEKAAEGVDAVLYETMVKAAENIRRYHEKQLRETFFDTKEQGKTVGMRITPKKRAGVYVPGGSAAYPSSVLMNVIPAKVAGVKEIIMTTPLRDGRIPAPVAAAALISGVDRVFLCGGAQAVGALAYGTETIPKVDVIAGPGNIFVATAKRLVYGDVEIDMIAGPSEVLVIADETANPEYIAADLLSQAEHDALASSVLVTNSEDLAKRAGQALERQLSLLERNEIAGKSVASFGAAIVCPDMDSVFDVANAIAPEHLEVLTRDPMADLEKVENAGSIFLGEYSPEPLGDYFAGTNHVLPTNGTARFASPLSVDTFIKKSGIIFYSREGLCDYKDDIIRFAESEGLTAHANSVRVRFDD